MEILVVLVVLEESLNLVYMEQLDLAMFLLYFLDKEIMEVLRLLQEVVH
jgi:hypothetical protein